MKNGEPIAEGIQYVVDTNNEYRIDSLLDIDDVHLLAVNTQKNMREYGVSLYMTTVGKVGSVINSGGKSSIFEPEPPREFRGKIKSGVFIHCHPILLKDRVNDGTSLHVLPSYGDFNASLWSRVIGDYRNIASEYGLTMCVGVEGISRGDYVTRMLREKAGASDMAAQEVWKVLSGERAGSAFVNREVNEAVGQKFSMSKDIIVFSHTNNTETRYFLYVSWEKLKELQSMFGSLENICFGDGVDKLVQSLHIQVPHKKNLNDTASIVFARPQKR